MCAQISMDCQRLRMGEPVQLIALTQSQARLTYLANSFANAHLIRFLTVRASPDLIRSVSSAYPIVPLF